MSAHTRPWYCSNRLTDDWLVIEAEGGDLKMLKSLKIIRAIIVNLGLISITLFAIAEGGDPNLFGFMGLFVLGAYNGVEVLDYLSLLQAIAEAKDQQSTNSTDE